MSPYTCGFRLVGLGGTREADIGWGFRRDIRESARRCRKGTRGRCKASRGWSDARPRRLERHFQLIKRRRKCDHGESTKDCGCCLNFKISCLAPEQDNPVQVPVPPNLAHNTPPSAEPEISADSQPLKKKVRVQSGPPILRFSIFLSVSSLPIFPRRIPVVKSF